MMHGLNINSNRIIIVDPISLVTNVVSQGDNENQYSKHPWEASHSFCLCNKPSHILYMVCIITPDLLA